MIQGSCLCGQVRYEIRGAIEYASRCWCTMCQKQHGSAFGLYANLASADFVIVQGEDKVARYPSSPGIERGFCQVCGSSLTWQDAGTRDRIAVALGTFDTPYGEKVTRDLHLESKPGWMP